MAAVAISAVDMPEAGTVIDRRDIELAVALPRAISRASRDRRKRVSEGVASGARGAHRREEQRVETWTYSVVPVPGGWAVEQPSGLQLMFLSGGRAEAKAKQLAEQAAARGDCAEVLVFDRHQSLLAHRRYGQHLGGHLCQPRREQAEGDAPSPA
jgi:hypothetical protein